MGYIVLLVYFVILTDSDFTRCSKYIKVSFTVFPLTRINRVLFSSQIFGFVSDPFVNIFKFYYVMFSNMVSLILILLCLLNLPLCLVHV